MRFEFNKKKDILTVHFGYSADTREEVPVFFNPGVDNRVRVTNASDILIYLQYLYLNEKISRRNLARRAAEVFSSNLFFEPEDLEISGKDPEYFLKFMDVSKKMLPMDDFVFEECNHDKNHIHLTSNSLQFTKIFYNKNSLKSFLSKFYLMGVIEKNNYKERLSEINDLSIPRLDPSSN